MKKMTKAETKKYSGGAKKKHYYHCGHFGCKYKTTSAAAMAWHNYGHTMGLF